MNSELKQQTLIFLLVSIGMITLPHINHVPMPLFAFFSLLLIWRFLGIWKPSYLPNKLLVFLLTVCALALLYTQHQGVLGRDAGTSLFVTALGLKLLEIKKERDLYLISYLAFIVATSQFLFQQSLLMAGYILFVCSVLLATLVSINSYKPETIPALKTAGIIILQALPLAIILFILFPRVEAPRWMMFDDQHTAKIGLSDSLEPGSISQLGMSDELVFRVKFSGDMPPSNQRYWRGPVFSYTDGKRWTETKTLFFHKYLDKPSYSGSAYQYTLMMEPQDKDWVFALDMPTTYPQSLKKNALYQLINRDNTGERAEYKISSSPHYNTGYITKTERKDNLQLPAEPSEKIRQLVSQLHGFDQAAEIFIQAVLDHFTNENFHYTLMPPLMEDKPIETFLFESRYGFCSHYATAFVYLMRVAGIPARVVGGYQGGELNKVGGFLEIKQANAHAWVEVWLSGKGWTRFDPTAAIAPERIEQDVNIDLQIATGLVNFTPVHVNASKALSWMKQATQAWGSIEYSWQRWVINYTSDTQFKFLASLGIHSIKSMVYWLVGSIGLITCFLAWLILKNKASKLDKELILYQQFCKKLAKAGIYKQRGETALGFSLRAQKQRPDLADNINKITEFFIRIRYEKQTEDEFSSLLKQAIAQFKV
ncbi:MAG: DUF3488 domain-containing transglutaminase family protein [Methylococcales bacterium]|nr:DUF3488 domain-containing transglutaminase family protein [Methylococcales bacterium]